MNVHSHGDSTSNASEKNDLRGPDQRREAILQAALELFSTRGYEATSVPEIARAAAVATGTIYRHFTNKEELVNAIYCQWKERLFGSLLGNFPLADSPRNQFHTLFHRLAHFAQAHPLAFAFLELHHHAPYLSAASRDLERKTLQPIARMLQTASQGGITKEIAPELAIALVWGMFVGVFKAASLGHIKVSPPRIDTLERCAWDALRRDHLADSG